MRGVHCSEILKQIFPEMKLRGLVLNFYIHVAEGFIYSTMRLPSFLFCVCGRWWDYINRAQTHECRNFLGTSLLSSVADPDPNPDPDPPDPHVFGPPGSGSFYHRTKIVRKTLIPTML